MYVPLVLKKTGGIFVFISRWQSVLNYELNDKIKVRGYNINVHKEVVL